MCRRKLYLIYGSGLGFNGVVIDLQQHFETYPNCQILPKFTNKIYDNVADFGQLRAVESQPRFLSLNFALVESCSCAVLVSEEERREGGRANFC